MTDTLPPPEFRPEPPDSEPDVTQAERIHVAESAPRRRRDPLPILFGLGVIVLLGAVFYLWQHPLGQHPLSDTATPPAETAITSEPATKVQVAALQQQLEAAQRRLEAAQQQAQAAQQQAQAAQQQAQAAQQDAQAARQLAQSAQLQSDALQQRVDALEKRPAPAAPDLGPLETRIAALEKRSEQPPQSTPLPPELANLGPRMDALAARFEQLAGRQEQLSGQQQQLATGQQQLGAQLQGSDAALGKRLDTLEGRIGAVEQQAGKLSGLADRAGRIAKIQAAEAALDAGLPIGDLPEAPPALARFAAAPPPTEASLRLAFPSLAQAAVAAAKPETGHYGFWQGMMRRLESVITVRRGDQVIVGNPVQGTVIRAGQALDAGDLAGAVVALSQLQGSPAAVFAAWRDRAESLLEARRALAALAAHAALISEMPAHG